MEARAREEGMEEVQGGCTAREESQGRWRGLEGGPGRG